MTIKVKQQRANRILNVILRFGALMWWEANPNFGNYIWVTQKLCSFCEGNLGISPNSIRVLSTVAWQPGHCIYEFSC